MYLEAQKRLSARLRQLLKDKYDLTVDSIAIEIPPELNFGELATPVAFNLARQLRKAPKMIAAEIVAELSGLEGFAAFEVAGAGYINARLDRAVTVAGVASGSPVGSVSSVKLDSPAPNSEGPGAPTSAQEHSLVEHTSINPNKAAHIGHLRNAILGDSFVRLLRAAGQKVDVQNYIDNTGVQVADVVVGFKFLEGKSVSEVAALIAACEKRSVGVAEKSGAFDYYCWDLYAKTSQWYSNGTDEENAERKKLRYETLHLIEHGGNETAEMAELIATAVLRRHLETMQRLGIEYDFLPRESEILHLKFWESAFEKLKQSGVLYFENEGKNKGCWVMTRPGAEVVEGETNEDAKVIVRSNGTVTYVGKDIAYHLWKFGLLGKDFGYKFFYSYPGHDCWISTEQGVDKHPDFGGAQAIYNVIDSRQADPQSNVIQALRGMGHVDQANRYTHFSYEMVALTPRCAVDLGYEVAEEDLSRAYIEVSGRKGFGVKADDLIDKLIAAARAEVDARQTSRDEAERQKIAEQIAIGALRYFMLKYTRNSVIAFDFKDALSFEGETGPYIQYATVRIRNIFRKAGTTVEAVLAEFAKADAGKLAEYLQSESALDIWALWLRAGRSSMALDQCIASSEPSIIARHAFQLAQEFNSFYKKHHILTEEDPQRKLLLLATAAVALRELVAVLSWLGIESPEAM